MLWGGYLEGNSHKGLVHGPDPRPTLEFAPANVIRRPNGSLLATDASGERGSVVSQGDAWVDSDTLANAIDIDEKGIAIGRNRNGLSAPILINGQWFPIERTAPELPQAWRAGAHLVDTTPKGWVLARKGEASQAENAVLLPIRVHAEYKDSSDTILTGAVGVDDHTVRTTDPTKAQKDRIWIMAPAGGGVTKVKLKAPLATNTPLRLSAQGVTFGSNPTITLNTEESEISIAGGSTENTGQDVAVEMRLGYNADAISTPLGIKIMKRRTVKAKVWLVGSDPNPDGVGPGHPEYEEIREVAYDFGKEEIENYLNDRFLPQVNARFVCDLEEVAIRFDTRNGTHFGLPEDDVKPGNYLLDTNGELEHEIGDIVAEFNSQSHNINIYIVGGANYVRGFYLNPIESRIAYKVAAGIAHEERRICVVPCGSSIITSRLATLDTLAHEVGHVVAGVGHADDNKKDTGPVMLPGTNPVKRLMCSGTIRRKDGSSRLLVKQEWDSAEAWFAEEVD